MGDERASEREIQVSPKAMSGRAEWRGPKDCTPYSGRSPIGNAWEKSAEAIVVKMTGESRSERRAEESRNRLTTCRRGVSHSKPQFGV
jgi:hypothetical protein